MDLAALRLHDATFLGLHVDWKSGLAVLSVDTHAESERRIVIGGCRGFRLSREMPWGRSDSILACKAVMDDQGVSILVEMQSGDEVEVRGTGVHVEVGV